jgi:hypothetical protein
MPSAAEPDELCEEHWLSAFGYDERAYTTHKDMLDVELVSAYTDVYAAYDVYVYFLLLFHLSKGCNNQAYGLHLAWLQWTRS